MTAKPSRLNRRVLLLGLAGVLVATGTIWAVAHLIATRNRVQNVVLICMDTVRYDTFWLPEKLGIRDELTPWNGRAVRFRHAQSTSSWTMPAVSSVLTGLYPVEHATGQFQYSVADLDVMRPTGMAPEVLTLPEVLKANKFETVAVNSNPWLENSGVLQGISDENFSKTELVTPSAVDEIGRLVTGKERFFLYAHYMDAHGDTTPEEKKRTAESMSLGLREKVIAHAPGHACADPASETCTEFIAYVQSVLTIRSGVARILNRLDAAKKLDRTAVVLYADHGEEFTDHESEEQRRGNDPRGKYGTGHGHTMYQELLHVPLLAWHPHHANIDVATAISLVDVMPTILDWCGIESPRTSGVDLAEVTQVDGKAALKERPLFSSGIAYGTAKFAVLIGNMKKIEDSCPPNQRVFDLGHDPDEKNAFTTDRRFGARSQKLIAEYRHRVPVAAANVAKLSDEQVKSLQSVGYLKSDGRALPSAAITDCSSKFDHFDSVGEYLPDFGRFWLSLTNRESAPEKVVETKLHDGYGVAGDWTGSGYSGVGIYQQLEHSFSLFEAGNYSAPITVVKFSVEGDGSHDIPVVGDWDGDGKDTIGIYRPSTSTFFLRNSNSSGPPDLVVTLGIAGDKPVVGDWDGSGTTRVGVYRPAQSTFFLAKKNSSSTAVQTVTFGLPDDIPLAGDWDGDGVTTIGIFRPSIATFYLRNANSVGDADVVLQFGTSKSIPIVGRWARDEKRG